MEKQAEIRVPAARSLLRRLLCLALLLPAAWTARAGDVVTVDAAASLAEALQETGAAWRAGRDVDLKFSFAGSGTLARQVDNGAPVQVFASADARWMDFLQERHRIDDASRVNLLGNALVLVAPAGQPLAVRLQRDFDLPRAFTGKLCTGETSSVPVGIYAKQALVSLGWWDALQKRVVGADDVRAALAMVERGECALGIVYRTDAAISTKVTVLGEFPAGSHEPIVYPFALLPAATPAARDFFRYLQGDAARGIFVRHGFTVLPVPGKPVP